MGKEKKGSPHFHFFFGFGASSALTVLSLLAAVVVSAGVVKDPFASVSGRVLGKEPIATSLGVASFVFSSRGSADAITI